MGPQKKSAAYVSLGLISIIWGTTYLALSFGLDSLPPLFVSGGRQMISGLLILLTLGALRKPLPTWEITKGILLSGFIVVFLSNSLVTWALKYVPSGITAVMFTMVPIFVALISIFVLRSEKLNWLIAAGLIIGLVALILLTNNSLDGGPQPFHLMGFLVLFAGILAWAIGALVSKKVTEKANPMYVAGIQLFVFGALVFVISFFIEDIHIDKIQPASLWAIGYLIIFDSIVGYGCYLYALSKLPATVVSLYAYIAPVVALFAGWMLRAEKFTLTMGMYAVIALAGVYLVERGFETNKKETKNENE